MASNDAPDWERVVVTVEATGDVPDAPDWERIVVGSGGTPIGGGGVGTSLIQPFVNAGFLGVTMHPYTGIGGASLLGGTLYIMPFAASATATVNNVLLAVATGTSLTSTTTIAGIYDWGEATAGTMTLLCASASGAAATVWASSGIHPVAMSTHPTLTAGKTYAVAVQIGGGPLPVEGLTLSGISTGGLATFPIGASLGGSATTLPGTITFLSANIALRTFLAYVD